MLSVKGPFLYATDFVNKNTPGETDADKTDFLFKALLSEIEAAGSCVQDVIAVQKFVAPGYDNSITKEIYSKYFKPYKPSLTVVTFENLSEVGGGENDVCKILVLAVKGCSRNEEYNGIKLDRTVYPSGSPLEEVLGYSRAVKAGPFIFVGGTTSVLPDKTVFGAGDSKAQDEFIWKKITGFAEKCGASLQDIVKVKKFVVPEYVCSGSGMPVDDCKEPKTETVRIQKLTRPGQFEETELCAVAGISSGSVEKSFADFFDEL
ncbi:Rid family hydrolase [Treponema sp.]|uniref:Rid family hydrolase n=1 Tax=Treponema sp. TaxID=166 RepID=UPI003F09DBF7